MRKKSEVIAISASEQKVLNVLLNRQNEKTTVREVCSILEGQGIKWATRTVSTFLDRIEQKGYAAHERIGITNYYYPTVRKEDYRITEGRKLLDTYFDGSIKNFIAAFADGDAASKEDIAELKEWVEKNK